MFIRIVVIFSLLLSGIASLSAASTQAHQNRLGSCVAHWADQYTETAQRRSVANTDRLDALNKLLVDALSNPGTDVANAAQEKLLGDIARDDEKSAKKDAAKFLAILKKNRSNPTILRDVQNYTLTENTYNTAVIKNPLPTPPKEVC